jgi:hypothetical protein
MTFPLNQPIAQQPWITAIRLLALLLYAANCASAQYWIAGDASGWHRNILNETFSPDSRVTFDMDCDGSGDLAIYSSQAVDAAWPWVRLSISRAESVQVLNAGVGRVSTFSIGDTLHFADSLWTEHLDFIYGTGTAGSYGHYEIAQQFIAFRKNAADTAYCFILFSNTGIVFSIHEVISACAENPIAVSTPLDSIKAFPNPFNDILYIRDGARAQFKLLDARGRLMRAGRGQPEITDLQTLPSGLYFLEWTDEQGERGVVKLFKN